MGIIATALGRPQTYAGYAREAVDTLRCALLFPFGLAEPAFCMSRPTGDLTHDTPVLLVHGFGHNRSGWFGLDRALRRAGFTSTHTMNYTAGRASVPELAAKLAGRVEEIRRLTGAEKVHVVGHSLGGVLLRWYVQEMGGDQTVDAAITIASPHEGAIGALFAPGRTARDLRPGSLVMRRLAAGAKVRAVRWVALYSNLDAVVQPATSAMLRAPKLHATNVLVKDHGHVSIMLSSRTIASVIAHLEAGVARDTVVAEPTLPRIVAIRDAA